MNPQEPLVVEKAESWKMFNAISKKYDLLNRILSFGQDLRWRSCLLKFFSPGSNLKVLDLATGTADVAITLTQGNPNIYSTIGVDPAAEMLKIGKAKIDRLGLSDRITLQQGDAQALNFVDNTFDAVTISFGIRNIPDLRLGLIEMYRVLKPQGRVMILEFSLPQNPLLRAGHWVYLQVLVPIIGFIFSGNYRAYRYLNQTIETFPYGEQFCRILRQFGFKDVCAHPLMGGVATIYVGQK